MFLLLGHDCLPRANAGGRRVVFMQRGTGRTARCTCRVSSLESTLVRCALSVHSKGLTELLTPLESTLMKKPGEGVLIIIHGFQPSLSYAHAGWISARYI